MPLSPADQALIANMKQREIHLKGRQRAADAIRYKVRRYRALLVVLAGTVGAVAGAGIFLAVDSTLPDRPGSWRLMLVNIVLGAILGVVLGQSLLRARWGQNLISRKEAQFTREYTGELHAGRRWLRFYYEGEDISEYVPQILYFIEGEQRFDSVQGALAYAKDNRRERTTLNQRALDRFNSVAAKTTVVAVATTDEAGTTSIRPMRFVKSDRPGVWYVTTAPEGHKVGALDQGRVALLTQSTDSGATIGSNRVQIRRVPGGLPAVADLYRDQVPGYLDGLTEDEKQRELVFELTLRSAKVVSWLEHEFVEFHEPKDRSAR